MNEYITKLVQEMIWKPKPLSDDEIIQLSCDTFYGLIKKEERDNFIKFARAIEERHGIK